MSKLNNKNADPEIPDIRWQLTDNSTPISTEFDQKVPTNQIDNWNDISSTDYINESHNSLSLFANLIHEYVNHICEELKQKFDTHLTHVNETSSKSTEYLRMNQLLKKLQKQLKNFSQDILQDVSDSIQLGIHITSLRNKYNEKLDEYERIEDNKNFIIENENDQIDDEIKNKHYAVIHNKINAEIQKIMRSHNKLTIEYNEDIMIYRELQSHIKVFIAYTSKSSKKSYTILISDIYNQFDELISDTDDVSKQRNEVVSTLINDISRKLELNKTSLVPLSRLESTAFKTQSNTQPNAHAKSV